MKLDDFGLLLTSAINSPSPIIKTKILSSCDNHRKELLKKQEIAMKKQENYNNNYERKRDEDEVIYRDYLQQRLLLLNKWKQTGNIKDLNNLISLKVPELNLPKEIYTHLNNPSIKM